MSDWPPTDLAGICLCTGIPPCWVCEDQPEEDK